MHDDLQTAVEDHWHTTARISDPRAPAENCILDAMAQMAAKWGFACGPKGVKKKKMPKMGQKRVPCRVSWLLVACSWLLGGNVHSPRCNKPAASHSGPTVPPVWVGLWIRAGFILAFPSGRRCAIRPRVVRAWAWPRRVSSFVHREMVLDAKRDGPGREVARTGGSVVF